jgi:hypothetical protein
MIDWLKHPSPVSAFGRSTLSRKGRGEAGMSSHTLPPSPLPGEGARRADEGVFEVQNCAIWNDIRRALEGDKK